MSDLESSTVFFDRFEAREDAFRRLVDFKLARRYGGPALFWEDFREITSMVSDDRHGGLVASITSNPRDCLAFATAEQILRAALMSAGEECSDRAVAEVASRFGLAGLLTQPIRTLSGGESVKLALAKIFISIPSCRMVVISSPFAWLSPANRRLLDTVVERCRRAGKTLSILAMEGENDLTPASSEENRIPIQRPVPFALKMSGARIPLTLSLNPLDDSVPYAAIADTDLEFESPCLISGENGQGKSLVARAVAGSLSLRGQAVVKTERWEGPASLLFQDVQTQTLMRSFEEIGAGSGQADSASIRSVFSEIAKAYNGAAGISRRDGDPGIGDFEASLHPLIDVKALLVAARLAAAPSALVLDEPDWGLSRRSALRFVGAVIATAHRRDIPVMLISHKPWWRLMMCSRLLVSRSESRCQATGDEPVFTVFLRHGGRAS